MINYIFNHHLLLIYGERLEDICEDPEDVCEHLKADCEHTRDVCYRW